MATISGYNEYRKNLMKDTADSKAKNLYSVSLTLFDTKVEKLDEVVNIVESRDLTWENYVPDGMTSLYDAVMQTILNTERLIKANHRKVVCVIMTDGGENSSKEYTQKDVALKIKELQEAGNWTFVFLGANQDSWAVAQAMNFHAANVSNFNATGDGVNKVFATMSANTRGFAASGQSATSAFFSKKDQDELEHTK